MLNSPFGQVKITPHPVVPTDNGWIYFAKKGEIEVNLMPISLQQQQSKEAKVGLLMIDAAEELAKEKGVSVEEANRMFFDRLIDGTVVKGISPLPYLKGDAREEYMNAALESREIPVKVASLMMQHRCLYSIHLTEPAKIKAKQLAIAPTWFTIYPGMAFKNDKVMVLVTEPYDPESGLIGVEPLAAPLEEGSDLFQLDADRKNYVMGIKEWNEEATRSNMSIEKSDGSISDIGRIYQFYLIERGLAAEEPEEVETPKKSRRSLKSGKASGESSTASQSTGSNSTGESNLTESETIDSTAATLELVPHG